MIFVFAILLVLTFIASKIEEQKGETEAWLFLLVIACIASFISDMLGLLFFIIIGMIWLISKN